MGYSYELYSSWEDSIIFELQSSDKSTIFTGNICHTFMDRLYPFTSFIGPSSALPHDQNIIRHLTKEYSSFLLKSVSIPNLLTESQNLSNNFVVALLYVYNLCLNCLEVIAPELGELYVSLDHRCKYINILRHLGRYAEAESESITMFKKLNGDFNPQLCSTLHEEKEMVSDNSITLVDMGIQSYGDESVEKYVEKPSDFSSVELSCLPWNSSTDDMKIIVACQAFAEMPKSEASDVTLNSIPRLPNFDGSNPEQWLSQANQYFKNHAMYIQDEWDTLEKVKYASYFMMGVAGLWFKETFTDQASINWECFCEHMLEHFADSTNNDGLNQYRFNILEGVNTVIDGKSPLKSYDAGSYPVNAFPLTGETIVICTNTSFNKWNPHLSHSWTVGEFEVGFDYINHLHHILYCVNDNCVMQFDPGGLLLKFTHYKKYIQASDRSSLENSIHFDSIGPNRHKNCHSLVPTTTDLFPVRSIVTGLGAACENWKKILGTYVEPFHGIAYLNLAFIVQGFHTGECCPVSIFLLWKNFTQIVDSEVIWFLYATQKKGICASGLNHSDAQEFECAHQLMSDQEHLIGIYSFCHIKVLRLRLMILYFIRIWDPGSASFMDGLDIFHEFMIGMKASVVGLP